MLKLIFWPGLHRGPRWGAYEVLPDALIGWGGRYHQISGLHNES